MKKLRQRLKNLPLVIQNQDWDPAVALNHCPLCLSMVVAPKLHVEERDPATEDVVYQTPGRLRTTV